MFVDFDVNGLEQSTRDGSLCAFLRFFLLACSLFLSLRLSLSLFSPLSLSLLSLFLSLPLCLLLSPSVPGARPRVPKSAGATRESGKANSLL